MPVWLVLGIYALAHARLTGLTVADQITKPARDAILRQVGVIYCDREGRYHLGPACEHLADGSGWSPNRRRMPWLGKLLTCSWCAGLWLALIVAPVAYWLGGNPWVLVPAIVLALSQITGMTSDLGRR